MTEPLFPASTLADMYPANTLLLPRGSVESTRWITQEAYRLDSLTGVFLTVMGDMPLLCHRNVATASILDFFREAGMPIASRLKTYTTETEAAAIAEAHVHRGGKVAFLYPPSLDWAADEDLLIPLSLYYWLNDKGNLSRLVAARHTPANHLFPIEHVDRILDWLPGKAVFVKACREAVSGGGADVRLCKDMTERREALEWLATRGSQLTGVRVEEAVDVRTCWCVNLAVTGSDITYLGAASQLFSAPAKQCGSRIDPADAPSPQVVEIARTIAARARAMGYRGVAGFDIGVSRDGRPYVFDLNFRFVSCTPQVMLHQSAVQRAGMSISQSLNVLLDGALERALGRIADHARRGLFLPTRLYEATPGRDERSIITGVLVGNSLAELEATESELLDLLTGLSVETVRFGDGSTSPAPQGDDAAATA